MTQIFQAEEREGREIEKMLHPLVREWFFSKFKDFSITQRYGVLNVWERKNILIWTLLPVPIKITPKSSSRN